MHRVRQQDLPFKGSSPSSSAPTKAGEIHSFRNTGDTPLVQVDVHLSPRFVQEDLPDDQN